jgi:hypothetical protein
LKLAATPEEFETILTNVLEDLTIRIDGLEIGAPLQRNINEWTASLLYKSDLMIDLFWTLIDPMKQYRRFSLLIKHFRKLEGSLEKIL